MPAFSLLLRHFQSLPTPQTQDPRRARWPRFSTQQRRDPAITETRPLTRQLPHPLDQLRLVVTRLSLVTLNAPRLIQHLARPSLGNCKLLLELADRGPLPGRAYQFPSATCLSI